MSSVVLIPGLKVEVDGMSDDSLYPEQYTAWHLSHTQRIMQQVTLTKVIWWVIDPRQIAMVWALTNC